MYPIGATLEVNRPFYKHVGTYLGDGCVLHNHRIRGEETVSLAQFSEGKIIGIKTGGVSNIELFFHRVQSVLASPKAYNFFSNNCEHTVSRVREGAASSPQLVGYAILGVLIISTYALSRGTKL